MLDNMPEPEAPALVDAGIEIRATEGLLGSAANVEDAVEALLSTLGPRGYLAVMAYLDREEYASLAETRASLAARSRRPVTFGWGPRFLHSTGQLHKGGELVGAFLQITGVLAPDLEVPGKPYGYRQLILSQAGGDAKVLADAGRPVLRLHLTDASQVARVRKALES
jgi:glucose-6-phosphate isomerase